MLRKGIHKWIIRSERHLLAYGGKQMSNRKGNNYGTITNLIRELKARGNSKRAIRNILNFYD